MGNYLSLRYLIIMLFTVSLQANDILHHADSLYLNKEYNAALDSYRDLIDNDNYLSDNFNLNFKLGICYLSAGKYDRSFEIFSALGDPQSSIPEYVDYYQILSALEIFPISEINKLATKYLRSHDDHFLADSLRLHLAEYQYRKTNYLAAARHYSNLMLKTDFKNIRPYLTKMLSFCKYHSGRVKESEDLMYQVIKKYTSSKDALDIVKFQAANADFTDKYFFAIADVYLAHNYLTLVQGKLENYVRTISDAGLKEKARFYLLQVYYEKNEYTAALYGLNNLLNNLKNELLAPRIKLMIARCHLRLDHTEEAAQAYVVYAEEYPRRRLADDALWKAAWIYEEQGMIENALVMYEKINKLWPGSSYAKESKFRIGISYYRLGWYNRAQSVFSELAVAPGNTFDKHRGKYWLAKTYRASGREYEALEAFTSLGGQVFESYYATKSYLLCQDRVDSLYQVDRFMMNKINPLNEFKDAPAEMIHRFRRVFIIDELLGKEFAFNELKSNRYSAKSLSEWVGLAEIYKRLEAYNRAYRIYDYIDSKYYADLLSYEKPFLLKESFPLYYDNLINLYTEKRGLDQNLVLAVIRAESGYDRNAHSWANAYGLMQLIPRTANEVARELDLQVDIPAHLLDPEININLGTYYLRKLLKKFENRIPYALAAYNAGPHRVDRWREIDALYEDDLFVENIEFSQTRNYVRKVLRNYWVYLILSRFN